MFHTERELQQELFTLDIELSSGYTATFVRREVPVGGCIPDLVYVRFVAEPKPYLWPRRWSFLHSYVLWLLRRHSKLLPGTIARRSYESTERILPILQDLIRSGAVTEATSGVLRLSPAMAEVDAEVVAVEAKLRNWREALSQAVTYQRFADRVFVAMDGSTTPTTEKIWKRFRSMGVGLCAVARQEFEWYVHPSLRRRGLPGAEREYLISSAVAARTQTLWSCRYATKASFQA